jgi:hypothetical protein
MANDEKALTIDATTHLTAQVNDGDTVMVGAGIRSNTGAIRIAPYSDSTTSIKLSKADETTTVAVIDTTSGCMRVGSGTAPDARLSIDGTSDAATPALKIGSSTLISTPSSGSLEYDGSHFYFTIGSSRKQVDAQNLLRGFENRTDSKITWNNTTKALSIAVKSPATSFNVYDDGVQYNISTTKTATVSSPSNQLWWFWFSGSTLSYGTSLPATGFATCLVATVFLDASNNAISITDERHTSGMPWRVHEYLHDTMGVRFESGLAATRIASGTGGANGDAQVYLTNGVIWDEDVDCSITRSASPANDFEQEIGVSGTAGKFPIYYRSGSSANGWVKIAASDYPVHQLGVGGRITYNQFTGGAWQLTVISANNRYGVMYLVATTSLGGGAGANFSEPVIAIMGQNDYATLAAAQAAQYSDLSLGNLPVTEMKPIWKVIYITNTGFANTPRSYVAQLTDMRNVSSLPSGNFVSTAHGSLTGLTDLGSHPASAVSANTTNFTAGIIPVDPSGETTVQLALDAVDAKIKMGTGSPESVVTADIGSIYLRTDGSAGTSLYKKESGSGNTGWVSGGATLAGYTESSGTFNTAFGSGAAPTSPLASYNLCVGYFTGNVMGNAQWNTVVGAKAGRLMTTSSACTFVGMEAGQRGTTGMGNSTFVGFEAGFNMVSSQNTALGYKAMFASTASSGSGTNNIAVGAESMYGLIGGGANIAIGLQALYSLTYGSKNIGIGNLAGYTLTSSDNVAIGDAAFQYQTTGTANVCIGTSAGKNVTSGNYLTIVGHEAHQSNATENTAIGYAAHGSHTGRYGVAIGGQSMQNGSGDYNIAIGRFAMNSVGTAAQTVSIGTNAAMYQSGNDNTAVGHYALAGGSGSSTTQSVAIGSAALTAITSGSGNVGVGYRAGYNLTTQSYNIIIGYDAGLSSTAAHCILVGYQAGSYSSSQYSVMLGYQAGYYPDGNNNVGIGYQALYGNVSTSTASGNVAIGYQAGYTLSSGEYNLIGGYNAGNGLTTGSYNIVLGTNAGLTIATSSYNVYIGAQAGRDSTGADSVGIGYQALRYPSGGHNLALGQEAMVGNASVKTASGNTALGYYCLYSVSSGTNNTAIGSSSLADLLDGTDNVAAGTACGTDLTSGSGNVAIGAVALWLATTGSYNIALGYGTMMQTAVGASNNVAIGYCAGRLMGTGSSNICVGDNSMYGVAATNTGANNVALGTESLYGIQDGIIMLWWGAVLGMMFQTEPVTYASDIKLGIPSRLGPKMSSLGMMQMGLPLSTTK